MDLWADIQMIDEVVKSRARFSSVGKNAIRERDIDLAGGRLLIHFLGESNHNGLTADITSYYLDYNDTPPWDTWVQAFVPESFARQAPDAIPGEYPFLISWVPSEFLKAVDEAAEAECVGMLMWADALRRWETPPLFADSVPLWLEQLS